MVKKIPNVCPAPAENIKVCHLCALDVETCETDSLIKDRAWLRETVVWCSNWEPKNIKKEAK